MQAVIVGWMIYELTHDPFSLGLIGLAEAIPALSVALYAGYAADLYSKRTIILITFVLMFFCSFSFLLLSFETMNTTTAAKVHIMYFIIFITGIARGFLSPAVFSLLPQLLTKEHYANSSAWNSSAWQIGAVTGPALGGLVYGFAGASVSFSIVIMLLSVCFFLFLGIKTVHVSSIKKEEPIIVMLKEGIKFVFHHKIIIGALSLDLFAVLFGGAVALLPVFAKEILLIGPEGLGFLRAAPSFGAAITMIALAYFPPVHHAGKKLMVSVAGFGICMIFFAISRNYALSLILLAMSGSFDSVSVIIRSTILQTMVPDNMRGRVSSVNTMFIGSSNEIGAFESGLAAKLLGPLAERYKSRAGGYVRIIKAGFRPGDNSAMAIIELVDRDLTAKGQDSGPTAEKTIDEVEGSNA